MKVIDLLNKIANGEEIPKKFIYRDYTYYLQSGMCHRCDEKGTIFEEDYVLENLNDEIEIIEGDKKIEKIKEVVNMKNRDNMVNLNIQILFSKINEIIEVINNER